VIPAVLCSAGILVAPGVYSVTPPDTSSGRQAAPVSDSGIPSVCYHDVDGSGSLSVSPAELRRDLAEFYEAGCYLVTPSDIEDGFTQIPSGSIPLLVSFDDGWQSQFNIVEAPDGSLAIDPQCALGVLESFCDEHPDFGRGATFFISWDKVPFGQAALVGLKLNMLLDMGYEIGNHTRRHTVFSRLDPSLWPGALTDALDCFKKHLGIRTGEVRAAAWPGGRIPDSQAGFDELRSAEFEGSPAVTTGFLVDGALFFLSDLEEGDGRFRISRTDMARYSVVRLLGHRGLMDAGGRSDLHDPMPWRYTPLTTD
jgi:hypothetical protein